MFQPNRLIEWRKKRGLTQEQLAQKIQTTKGTISNYENGHSTPPNETLVAIANVLGISTDYLLGRTNDPQGAVNEQQEYDQNFLEFKEMWDSISEEDRQYLFNLVKNLVELKKESKGGK